MNPWNGGWIPWNGGWIPFGLSSWNYDSTLSLYQFQGGIHMDSRRGEEMVESEGGGKSGE